MDINLLIGAAVFTPLAGLVGLAFWTGILSQRVNQLSETAKELRDASAEVAKAISERSERTARLEEKSIDKERRLTQIDHRFNAVHRMLANLASGNAGKLQFLPPNIRRDR